MLVFSIGAGPLLGLAPFFSSYVRKIEMMIDESD
jgi:hypothetical protein